MDNKKKPKVPFYQEGHKRETRKSYQAYIEEIAKTGDSKKKGLNVEKDDIKEEEVDDSSIRRSKRTPVPKRGFKLIDTYDTKKNKTKDSKDTKTKEEETDDVSSQDSKSETTTNKRGRPSRSRKFEESPVEKKLPEKQPQARKSETSRRRKQSESNENQQEVPVIDKEEIKVEKESESPIVIQSQQPSQESSQSTEASEIEEATPSRRSGRIRKPKQFEDSVTPNYRRKSRGESVSESKTDEKKADSVEKKQPSKTTSPRKAKIKEEPSFTSSPKRSSRKRDHPESKEATPVPAKKKRIAPKETPKEIQGRRKSPKKNSAHHTQKETKRKYEPEDSLESSQSSQLEQEINNESVIGVHLDIGGEVSIKEEDDDNGIVDTNDNNLPSKVNEEEKMDSLKITLKTQPERERTTKKKKRKKQEEKKKSEEKLFVSFKKKKKRRHSETPLANNTETSDNEAGIGESLPIVETRQSENEVKKKKKKKKKENKEMVDIQTFPVEDTVIVRVKKKKVFKRRNGEKILVRITKNHCNKNDEVVRTETVVFNDNLVHENRAPQAPVHSELNESDMQEPEEIPIPPQKMDSDEEYFPTKTERKAKEKEETQHVKKKPPPKKTVSKPVKRTTTRPANKNVTVGGKVVGKTTKGMKKTGTAVMKKTGTGNADGVRKNQLMREKQSYEKFAADYNDRNSQTEPKNAYNLFCRKYRPIIMASHPKADFSEISKRLACLWNMASDTEKQEHRKRFDEMQAGMKSKLTKLSKFAPSAWADKEFDFIKKAIQRDLDFTIPTYSVKHLEPLDMAAHFQLLGESLTVIAGALEQQSGMTVHGAMSVLLDSILCSMGPLVSLCSHIPGVNAISEEQQARILDNLTYIMPGV